MTSTAIVNIVLAAFVIVMVVAPLAWAIRTSPRDVRRLEARARRRAQHEHATARRRSPGMGRAIRPEA